MSTVPHNEGCEQDEQQQQQQEEEQQQMQQEVEADNPLTRPIPIPSDLSSSLRFDKLRDALVSTRAAVRVNATVLSDLCGKFDSLAKHVSESEARTEARLSRVVNHVEEAVTRANTALDEAQRLSDSCVSKEEFNAAKQQWERRLRRLERATGEILEDDDHDDRAKDPQQTSDSKGPLGNFVSNMISAQTAGPLRQLHETITEEWDGAFQSLGDDAFAEMAKIASEMRIDRRDTLRQMEELQRDSFSLAHEIQAAAALSLRDAVSLQSMQTRSAIDDFGFEVRREVASMLFHTRNQTQTLQRAITRLRNTLCLPPDSETIATASPAVIANFNGASQQQQRMSPASSGWQQQQQQQQPQQQQQRSPPHKSNTNDSSTAATQPTRAVVPVKADFGELRPEEKRKRRLKRKERKHSNSNDGNDNQSEDDDGAASASSTSSDPHPELYDSMLIPRQFLQQQQTPQQQQQRTSHQLAEDRFFSSTALIASSASSSQRAAAVPPVATTTASVLAVSPLDRRPSFAADIFTSATADVDIREILQTPIFVALRELIEQTAINTIDARDSMRESTVSTELHDMRQQLMKKVSVDVVSRMIERGKDHRAAEQLEYVTRTVRELQGTVIKEHEWRQILRSKADFSLVDQVRVDTSRRCQSLEDDVKRLERAVVVGFGESLRIAPPATFQRVEEERLKDEAERNRLFLERGGVDDIVDVLPSPSRRNYSHTSPEKEEQQQQQQQPPRASSALSDVSSSATGGGATSSIPRGTAEDARSVVVASPRQFLHSAPPSRPRQPFEQQSQRPSSSNNNTVTSPQQQPRVGSAGRGGSRYALRQGAVEQQQQRHQQWRGRSPENNDDNDDGTTNHTSSSSQSNALNNSSSSSFSASQRTQVQRPPRHSLIYTGAAGGGTAGARPATAGAQQPQQPSSTSGEFSHSLRVRCRLNEEEVTHW